MCRVMVPEPGNRDTTKQDLSQNYSKICNSFDPPVHGDTSQYHSLTEEEGGLEKQNGRSSLGGHAQSGQVMLHLLNIMPGHSMCKEKTKQK